MKSEWKDCILSELITIIGGGTPKTSNKAYWNGIIPWLSVKDFNNDERYVFKTEKTITEYGLANSSTSMLQKDDIIISARGTVGEMAMVPYPMAFNQSCYGIRGNENIEQLFLYYLIKYNMNILRSKTHGSVFETITRETILNLTVKIPSLKIQKIISNILSVLDDKIMFNNKINDNLEQQIELLFNHKYSPFLLQEDWPVGVIGDVVTLQRGYDLPKEKMLSGQYPVAGSKGTIFYHSEYTTEPPCIIMGRSGNIGYPRLYMEKCWSHNTTLFVKDFKESNPYWAYYMLRKIDYSQFQGGSAVPTLNRNHIHSYEIAIPPLEKQNEFGEQVLPKIKLIENNKLECQRLSSMRNILLPKFMSGELDVSDIDI